MDADAGAPHDDADVYASSKASQFQFKSTSSSRSKRRHRSHEPSDRDEAPSSKRHRASGSSSHRKHHRSKRSHRPPPAPEDPVSGPSFSGNGEYDNPDNRYRESLYDALRADLESAFLHPDQAFRESLFDALADDEGAAYWEGVYGQPIHIYPDQKAGPDGKLERMSEEEYAEYVRKKMWEKSHEHILEEREAKERARKQRAQGARQWEEETARQEAEAADIRRQVRESLKRGEQRKRAREAEAAWTNYVQRWEELKANKHTSQAADVKASEMIPWPVVSGKRRDVSETNIEHFMQSSAPWKEDPATMLKVERVRWHPDKMQQRFGQHVDTQTMKSVTAVFQTIDRMWDESRKSSR